MGALKFSESFWNTDITSTVGFDILLRKVKEGRNSSKEIETFIKDRAKIEDDYGKALLKLSKSSLGTCDRGSLGDVLQTMKVQTERAASIHLDMSQNLGDQMMRMHSMRERDSAACKSAEEAVKRAHGSKKDLYNKTTSSQQTYQKKSQAFDQAQTAYNHERSLPDANQKSAKEVEKLDKKQQNCLKEKLIANDAYKSFVEQLEEARKLWEGEMERVCEDYEQVELERINYFRKELWIYLNIHSKTMADVDETNNEIRKVLEICDAEEDIQAFIESSQTGSIRPAPIVYESCDTKHTVGMTLPRSGRPPVLPSSTFFRQGQNSSFDEDPTYASIP